MTARPKVDLAAPCPRCGRRRGEHTVSPNPSSGSTCPDLQDWYCWECANTGAVHRGLDDLEVALERVCPCCEANSHRYDADRPPCHRPAKGAAS